MIQWSGWSASAPRKVRPPRRAWEWSVVSPGKMESGPASTQTKVLGGVVSVLAALRPFLPPGTSRGHGAISGVRRDSPGQPLPGRGLHQWPALHQSHRRMPLPVGPSGATQTVPADFRVHEGCAQAHRPQTQHHQSGWPGCAF